MPTASRNARKKSRAKRTASLLKRGLQQAMFQSNKNFSLLAAVLTQQGGETLLSKETLDSVLPQLGRVTVNTENTDAGLRVYMVSTVDASELPAESLDEMKARMQAAHNDEVPAYTPPVSSVAGQLAAVRTTDAPESLDPTDAALDPA